MTVFERYDLLREAVYFEEIDANRPMAVVLKSGEEVHLRLDSPFLRNSFIYLKGPLDQLVADNPEFFYNREIGELGVFAFATLDELRQQLVQATEAERQVGLERYLKSLEKQDKFVEEFGNDA